MKKVLSLMLTVMLLFALAVNALPAPSVEGTEAPEIVQIADSEGNLCDALLIVDGAEVAVGEDEELQIVVDPIADETVAEEAIDFLASTGVDVEDAVVLDMFDVTLVVDGEVYGLSADDGASLIYAISTDLSADDEFYVLHNYAPEMWEVVDVLGIDENGVVMVTVDSLSPFVIVKMAPATDIAPIVDVTTGNTPASPQTGDAFPMSYVVCALLCACAAVVLFKKAGKKA